MNKPARIVVSTTLSESERALLEQFAVEGENLSRRVRRLLLRGATAALAEQARQGGLTGFPPPE